ISHEFLDYEPTGWLETTLTRVGSSTDDFFKENGPAVKTIALFVINGLVIGYFLGCLYYYISFIYFFIIYFLIVKRYFGRWFEKNVWTKMEALSGFLWRFIWFRLCTYVVIIAAIASFLYFDTKGSPERLISLHPGRINWRSVLSGLLLQFLFGVLFIRWDPGRAALQCFSDKVNIEPGVIFFFSMLVEILFFWGALQWFCLKLGELLRTATSTTVWTILASYIGFGASPAHLVTASVIEDQSTLSAATRGATNGIALILNIVANIVAFVAFIAFVNGMLSYCGSMLGHPELNLEWIMGKVFIPLCWVMGE
ncbi:Sodium/nucleoside cotransporter, partial [Operophtera brumata]